MAGGFFTTGATCEAQKATCLLTVHHLSLSAQLWVPELLSRFEDNPLSRYALFLCCLLHPWKHESQQGHPPALKKPGSRKQPPSQHSQSLVKKECPLVGLVWSCSGSVAGLSPGQNGLLAGLPPRILKLPSGLVCFSPCVEKQRRNSRRAVVRAAPAVL